MKSKYYIEWDETDKDYAVNYDDETTGGCLGGFKTMIEAQEVIDKKNACDIQSAFVFEI